MTEFRRQKGRAGCARSRTLWPLATLMFLWACAGGQVSLGTLEKPPQTAKIRVYVKTLSHTSKTPFKLSDEASERMVVDLLERALKERGEYEVLPREVVARVAGDASLMPWHWSREGWALAREAGRRLHADYALIVERSFDPDYLKYLLINVQTAQPFEEIRHIRQSAGAEAWFEAQPAMIDRLLLGASGDLAATAARKGEAVNKDLAAVREEIRELRQIPVTPKPRPVSPESPMGSAEAPSPGPPSAPERDHQIAGLEAKVARLMGTLAEVEEMKRQFEDQRRRAEQLARDLAAREEREKALLTRLEDQGKVPPVIVLASPPADSTVQERVVTLSGVVEDDRGIRRVEVRLNEKPLMGENERGVRIEARGEPRRIELNQRIVLEPGANRLWVRAFDTEGLVAEKKITVRYEAPSRNVWAVVIGIDRYPRLRPLRYAVNDATRFYDHLVKRNRIPAANVVLLRDEEATLTRIRSVLGTDLKNQAGPEDMVIIYFAGHGASERDAGSPDGDGLEKYLLPADADLKNLYATALPMEELARLFKRIRSERLVFIADACYSGASGGRTMGLEGMRASLSDAFIDRVAGGKGRVILTASAPNEVSAERDEFRHGVFTYYLLEGLQGAADADRDGAVTVDEAYNYVSRHVPRATGQEQHPVKKGSVEGRLVLGVIP